MERRIARLGCLAAALVLALGSAQAEGAAVLCQKGNRIKLRADTCRAGETLAPLSGDDPAGVWKYGAGTTWARSGLQPEFLVLDADGSGRLNLSGGDGPVRVCLPLRYRRGTNRTLVLDIWDYDFATQVFRFELGPENALRLVDAVGQAASFERAPAVDSDKECGSLAQSARFAALPRPDGFSGLAFDGTELWYTESDSNKMVPVDPATGSAGAPVGLYHDVHAAQGDDFWAHGGIQGSLGVTRWSRAGQKVDEVFTGTDLGSPMEVEALAFDSGTGVLWLHGRDDAGEGRLLKVDPSAEPDVLVAAFDLDASISGLAAGANALWAVDAPHQSVMRVDLGTGKVTGTFLIPDRSAYWQGIAAVGNQLFLIGGTDRQGALLVLETPLN